MSLIGAVAQDERQREREPRRAAAPTPSPDVAAVLALQRGAGNQAVARMLARPTLARVFDPYVTGAPVTMTDDGKQKVQVKPQTRCEVDLDNVRQGESGPEFRIRLIDAKTEGWIDKAGYVTLQALDFGTVAEPEDDVEHSEGETGEGGVGGQDEAQADDSAFPVVSMTPRGPDVNVTPALRMRYQQDLRRLDVWLEEREGDALARKLGVFARVMKIEPAAEEPKAEAKVEAKPTTRPQKGRTPQKVVKDEAKPAMLTETLSYGDAGAGKKGFIAFDGTHYLVLKRLAKHAKGTYADKDGYGYTVAHKTRVDGSCLADALHIVRYGRNANDEQILDHRAHLAALDDPDLDPLLESLVQDLLAGKAVLGLGPAVRRYLNRNSAYIQVRDALIQKRAEQEQRMGAKESERKEKSKAYAEAHKGDEEPLETERGSQARHLTLADVKVVATEFQAGAMKPGSHGYVTGGGVDSALATVTRECGKKHFAVPDPGTHSNYWAMQDAFGRAGKGRVSLDQEPYEPNLPRWQRVKLQPGGGQQGGWLLYVPEDGSYTYDAEIMLSTLKTIATTKRYHLVYPTGLKSPPPDPQLAATAKPTETKLTKKELLEKKMNARAKK